MRRAALIILAYSLVFLSALLPLQRAAAPNSRPTKLVIAPAPANEVRALWVVRTSMTSPEAVSEMVRRAKEAGFTDLIVQIRGRGDAYYQSRWETRAATLADADPKFDPLALTIEQAHAAGLKVHAWLNTFLVADLDNLPKDKNHVIYQHPEWLAVPRDIANNLYRGNPQAANYFDLLVSHSRANNKELEGLFLSPAHPAVKEQLYGVWMDVLEKYDVDGMHFDYIRYPNKQYDYSRTALDRFRSEVEKTLDDKERDRLTKLAEDDPLIHVNAYPERFAQFQRDQVTELVERLYTGVKARKPKALVSAAVFANDEDAFNARFQDWKQWARRGILDVICPMAYNQATNVFSRQIEIAVSSANAGRQPKPQVWAGIGAWLIPVDSSLEKISAARQTGAQGFILFSYDSSIKTSELNPRGEYLQRIHDALGTASPAGMSQ